jgi:hypothetical protein
MNGPRQRLRSGAGTSSQASSLFNTLIFGGDGRACDPGFPGYRRAGSQRQERERRAMKITIPKAAIVTAFNTALGSMSVLLQTLGKRKGTSWYNNISHIRLPTGAKWPIPVPEYTYNIGKFRKLKYYLDQMESATIQATAVGNRIRVDVRFESQGEEIKVKCIRRLFRKWGECSLDMERDIHLDNALLSISFVPVAYEGSISYADPKVTFKTDVKIASRLCQAFKGICGAIQKTIKTKLTSKVVSATRATFNSPKMKRQVANKVKTVPGLRSYLGGKKVLKVESKGNNFVVTVED